MIKIGSHVSVAAPDYILGAAKETIANNATAMMIYSGAPQNTIRKDVNLLKAKEAKEFMEANGLDFNNVVMHAPYIINLANTIKQDTYDLAVSFLKQEIKRTKAIGSNILVLHPGSHVQAGEEAGINSIIKGLNEVLDDCDIYIALETMAGKGTEIGYKFEQIAQIINSVNYPEKIKVCLDTCHIHDAGYNINDIDTVLEEFDAIIGLDKLVCIHINDSKNINGAKKDRHANIGHGEIGFDALVNIIHHDKLKDVIKILETPYIDGNSPYKEEINMLLTKQFKDITK